MDEETGLEEFTQLTQISQTDVVEAIFRPRPMWLYASRFKATPYSSHYFQKEIQKDTNNPKWTYRGSAWTQYLSPSVALLDHKAAFSEYCGPNM